MENPNRPVNHGYPANPPPATGGYAYAAPGPPPPNPYYNPYDRPIGRSNSSRFLTVFFAVMLSLFLFMGCASFVLWLIYRPQLPEVRVDTMTLSNLTITNTSLVFLTAQIQMTVLNPNKKLTLDYDRTVADIFYKKYSITETTIGPFTQDTKEKTFLTANFAAAGSFVDKWVADGIQDERKREGKVWLNLRMISRIKLTGTLWRTRERLMRVTSRDLVVAVSSDGSSGHLVTGEGQCRVTY